MKTYFEAPSLIFCEIPQPQTNKSKIPHYAPIKFCNKPRSWFCYCSLFQSNSQNFVNTLASTITVVIGINREKSSFVPRGVNLEDVEPSECAPKLFLILLRLEPVRVRAARAPPAAACTAGVDGRARDGGERGRWVGRGCMCSARPVDTPGALTHTHKA